MDYFSLKPVKSVSHFIKMGKCNVCGLTHPRPGEKSCKYQRQAVEKCKSLRVSEEDWRLNLDEETASRETYIVLDTYWIPKASLGTLKCIENR